MFAWSVDNRVDNPLTNPLIFPNEGVINAVPPLNMTTSLRKNCRDKTRPLKSCRFSEEGRETFAGRFGGVVGVLDRLARHQTVVVLLLAANGVHTLATVFSWVHLNALNGADRLELLGEEGSSGALVLLLITLQFRKVASSRDRGVKDSSILIRKRGLIHELHQGVWRNSSPSHASKTC